MSADVVAASVGSSLDYSRQRIALRLQLGEITLHRREFEAAVFRCEFVPPPANPAALAGDLFTSTGCDMVFFSGAPAAIRTGTAQWGKSICFSPRAYPLYCVDLTLSLDEYLKKFSSTSRKHLRRDVTKFGEHVGNKQYFKEYRALEEMQAFHEAAREVSKKTFQEHLLGVGLPATPDFIRHLNHEAAADNIRGYVLYHGNVPIAFAYCSAQGSNISYEIVGYDPAYRSHSPGRVLLYLIICSLLSDKRFSQLDFGGGDAFYKRFFATHSLPRADIYYLRRTVGNALFVTIHVGLSLLSRSLVFAVTRLGVKDRIKKWTRRTAQA